MSFNKENLLSLKPDTHTSFAEGKSEETLSDLFKEILNNGVHGLCFSLYEDGQKPGDIISEAQVRRRMEILKPHIKWVRSFSCTEGNEYIPKVAKEMGIKTVAVYSTADKDSLPVRFADEAVCIGGPKGAESYLNIPHIMAACEITNADAVHPGYGFLAENAKFAQICADHGIKFIGPTPEMINKMGDKITAKETMIKAGVPVVPGGEGLLESVEDAKKLAKEIVYPVIIKATAGGGGKGMRVVWSEAESPIYHGGLIKELVFDEIVSMAENNPYRDWETDRMSVV